MKGNYDPNDIATGGALDAYATAVADSEEADVLIGRELGDYRITSLIAAGGMAKVYRAQRTDGAFDRDVAIKVSPGSIFNAELRARFKREQFILAGLEHPNIARLFDAGITAEGWPYIVMELVLGRLVEAYCSEQDLHLDDIVELIITVADALAFAHSRLVIHCDLKPSNLLVAEDGRAVLLDFGIAKLLEADADHTSTRRPLSPKYASPEQLHGSEITIGSDIYQLGVLLQQLCAGANHGQVPRDVGLIIDQCLREDPAERYSDMNSLKQDLVRFRAGYPVVAAGASYAYRAKKFALRNLPSVIIGTGAIVMLTAVSLWYVWSVTDARFIAERESELSKESLEFLLGFFDDLTPEKAQDHDISARELVDRGISRVQNELADRPEVRSNLLLSLANLYIDFGEPHKAEELITEARDYYLTTYGPQKADSRRANGLMAAALFNRGEYQRAADLYAELVALNTRLDGPAHENTLVAHSNLAAIYWYLGRTDEATQISKEIYELTLDKYGPRDEQTLTTAYNYAASLQSIGELKQSLEILETTSPVAQEVLGDGHPISMMLIRGMATGYSRAKNNDKAKQIYAALIETRIRVHGEDHPETLISQNNLAGLYYNTGDTQKAVDLQEDILARMVRMQGTDHPSTMRAASQMAVGYARLGDFQKARALSQDVIARQTESLSATHPDTLNARLYFGEVLMLAEDENAQAYMQDLLSILELELGNDHYRTKAARDALAELDDS